MSEVLYMGVLGAEGAGVYHDRPEGPATGAVGRPEILRHRPDLGSSWVAADAAFPVRVTRSFWARTDPTDPADPLARQVLPDPAELVPAPGDLDDPVGDSARSPLPWVVHKYPDRVLVLVTKRCHVYCRYCFRRTHQPGDALDPTPEALAAALDYARTCGADEVILSGGDPLMLPDDRLAAVFDALADVPRLRVHSRAPITCPSRVTARLVDLLAARPNLRVVVHCNHPRELAPDVDAALGALTGAGVPVLNQAVLLRGVNDDVDVLDALLAALVARGVTPYYLHHTDAVTGNAHLRVPIDEGLALWAALRARRPDAPRYVIDPPDGGGKVDVATWVARGRGPSGVTAASPHRLA